MARRQYDTLTIGHISLDYNIDYLDQQIIEVGGAVIYSSASAYAGGDIYTCPIKARNLSGRSGRGDTTLAAYITERSRADIPEALLWATATVSNKMEAPGPYRGKRADIEAYIAEFYQGGK